MFARSFSARSFSAVVVLPLTLIASIAISGVDLPFGETLASPAPGHALVLAANLAPELDAEDSQAEVAAEWDEEAAPEVAAAPELTWLEQALFDAVNADRLSHGLAPLDFAPDLLDVARQRAQAQVDVPALNHYDGSGRLAFVVLFQEAGIKYRRAGENLARIGGSEGTRAPRAETALMNSPTHRSNILEGSFQQLAVGEGRDSRGNTTFAQIFINP